MKLLIDGDIVIYKAGFGANKQFKDTDKEVPLSFCLHNCSSLVNEMRKKVKESFPIKRTIVFLTSDDKSNFRYEAAKTREYKGNRKDSVRPPHYRAMKDHLIKKFKAIEVTGMEADDAIGIESAKNNHDVVIMSTDKDLRMIPGVHWDGDNQEWVTLDKEDIGWLILNDKRRLKGYGPMWYYAQLLLGDPVDNIPGVPRIGDVGAHKLLSKCKSIEEMEEVVNNAYGKANLPRERLEEVKKLITILQEPLSNE